MNPDTDNPSREMQVQTDMTSTRERLPVAEVSLIAWACATGLGALVLTTWAFAGAAAQVLGGVFLWGFLFSGGLLIAHIAPSESETQKSATCPECRASLIHNIKVDRETGEQTESSFCPKCRWGLKDSTNE